MPEHYIWDVSGDGSICTLLFMMNGFNFALMGQPLFHGYYTHHNMAESYIAFGPLRRGGSLPLTEGPVPSTPIEKAGRPTTTQALTLGSYTFMCLAAYYWGVLPQLNKYYNRNTDSEQKARFDGYTWGFFFFCFLVYHFVMGPALGINTGSLFAVITG